MYANHDSEDKLVTRTTDNDKLYGFSNIFCHSDMSHNL